MDLGCDGPLSIHPVAVVVVVVEAGLGVLLQLFGQVGARGCCGNIVSILRDLQLFHEAHRPGRQTLRGAVGPRHQGKVAVLHSSKSEHLNNVKY